MTMKNEWKDAPALWEKPVESEVNSKN